MATTKEYIEFVCEQLDGVGDIQYKKMFGEYIVYVNNKPLITVCDCVSYVKELKEIEELMHDAQTGYPYAGAKKHYILDIEDACFAKKVVAKLESITASPKPKIKKGA